MRIDNRLISKYRGELFGISIISIMIFHFFEDVFHAGTATGTFSVITKLYIALVGSIGVEIFVFLSGFGLYYSFSKNNDVKAFYKKRFSRIVPKYLIVAGICVFLLDVVILKLGVVRWLKDVFFVSFVNGDMKTPWFIAFILAMYLLFPLFYRLVEKIGVRGFAWLRMAVVLAVICAGIG